MDSMLRKGHRLRVRGRYLRAKACFERVANSDSASNEDKQQANYSIAYLHSLIAKAHRGSLSILGADLRQPWYDADYEAGLWLSAIGNAQFNPAQYLIPDIDSNSLTRIAIAHKEAARFILKNIHMNKLLSGAQLKAISATHPQAAIIILNTHHLLERYARCVQPEMETLSHPQDDLRRDHHALPVLQQHHA